MTDSFRPTVLRNKAWEALRGKWGMSAAVTLLFSVAFGILFAILFALAMPLLIVSPETGTLVVSLAAFVIMLTLSVIAIGYMFVFLDVSRGAPVEMRTLVEPVKNYFRYLGGFLLVCLYTFLWMLLLFIPGIIKAISYSQAFYIMRENPEMSSEQAIRLSMKMMKGHKWEYFLLGLSFIGWIVLCSVTMGIAYFWIYPYMMTASGAFYDEVKKDYEAREAFGAVEVTP